MTLSSVEMLMNESYLCNKDKVCATLSHSTLIDFVLPLKIYFRYCWMFSGTPFYCDSERQKTFGGETVYINRMFMADGIPELCSPICYEKSPGNQLGAMKSFWLTTDGRLVCVSRFSEDIKFRYLRERNLRSALSLWITHPELCRETVRASEVAHETLLKLCASATWLSQGRFYNLYARYPLPINNKTDYVLENTISQECSYVDEKEIDKKEITNPQELLEELEPLYVAYFTFLTNENTSNRLKDLVSILGAQCLVQQDRSELLFSLSLSRSLFTRILIRLAMFLDTH